MSASADRFEVEREVGTGGMGTVFRALDRETGATVALKVLQKQLSSETQRFLLEARVLSQLQHPAIVRYIAHGVTSEGAPYIAMEWLEGEDLWAALQRRVLTVDETVRLAHRLADALASAHSQGVVHRDIKPSNIFLPGGDIEQGKLLDFGVARILDLQRQLTMTGTFLGTPAYTAPEQARGEKHIGPEADVFSLGCVLFECLTGRGPFDADNVMAVLSRLLMEEPPRLREHRRDIPEPVATLIERMIVKDPRKRLSNGGAVVTELGGLATGHRIAAAAPYGPYSETHESAVDRLARSGLMRRMPDSGPPTSGAGAGAASAAAPQRQAEREPKTGPSPFESQITHIASRFDHVVPSASRPSTATSRRYKLMGFAAAVTEHSEKPSSLGPLSEKVFDALSRYISMPWAMMQSHCSRLKKDVYNLQATDLPELADSLSRAVGNFAGPKGAAALLQELKSLASDKPQP